MPMHHKNQQGRKLSDNQGGMFVAVAGYGWSGSSAVVDLLKEYEGVRVPDVEFRLVKDAHGLHSLKDALTSQWDLPNVTDAIEDYLQLCRMCYQAPSRLRPGLDYASKLSAGLMDATDRFIGDLVEFRYDSYTYTADFRVGVGDRIKRKASNKVRRMVGREEKSLCDQAYFSHPSEELFDAASAKYLREVFARDFSEFPVVVLDQGISALRPEALSILGEAKLIVVDRNPLDIYADLLECGALIGADLARTRDPGRYIEWHRAMRRDLAGMEGVLTVSFEELVLDSGRVIGEIESFVGEGLGSHARVGKFFDPEKSKLNIGRYAGMLSDREIFEIEGELL